jgi:prepilin-type N-terminal cleavage/methylation domain-containing protein
MHKSLGFTLVELMVVTTLIVILSSITLFTVSYYINRSKDSNIKGNLVILIPAGEVYYTGPGRNSYGTEEENFCDSNVVVNAFFQIPPLSYHFCKVDGGGEKWAACAHLFVDKEKAFCVDSRGVKEDIDEDDCNADIIECPQL